MPVIMLCCAVGSFAIGNNMFGVVTVAAFGVIGYVMEANGYPVAAMVLGIVMAAGILTGVELPCEPDKESELLELLEALRGYDVDFLNLNELEITVGNIDMSIPANTGIT